MCVFLWYKESDQAKNYVSDRVGRVPGLGVVVGDGEADPHVGGEAAGVGGEHDGGWFKRILLWELNLPHIESVLPRVVIKAENDKIPFKYVICIWASNEIFNDFARCDLLVEFFTERPIFFLQTHCSLLNVCHEILVCFFFKVLLLFINDLL